jgi:hypothetical protein
MPLEQEGRPAPTLSCRYASYSAPVGILFEISLLRSKLRPELPETMIPMIKRPPLYRGSACCVLATALWLTSCNFTHDGLTAFRASQKAAMLTKQFHIALERQTKMGNFKNSQSLDCDARYFYDHEVDEPSPEAIEAGVTLSQGRPSSHHESDTLSVEGRTYGRNTSSWENAGGNDDARPDWGPLTASRDPQPECTAMKRGEALGYVAYDIILKEGHIAYLGKQRVDGHKCSEYNISFDSRVLKSVKVCLGTSDDLPYRVVGEDYTAIYNYEPVTRLAAPVETPPAASQ